MWGIWFHLVEVSAGNERWEKRRRGRLGKWQRLYLSLRLMGFFPVPISNKTKQKTNENWIHKVPHLGLAWLCHNPSASFVISHLGAAPLQSPPPASIIHHLWMSPPSCFSCSWTIFLLGDWLSMTSDVFTSQTFPGSSWPSTFPESILPLLGRNKGEPMLHCHIYPESKIRLP